MAIGEQLGRLHSLRIPIAVVPSVAPADPKVETLLAGIPAEHAPGAQMAADLVVRYPPPRPSIIGHCDLDWKNVVFTDQRAVILDLGTGRACVPSAELTAATIEWSGFRLGEPDVAAARGLLRAYHKAGGVGTVDGIASFTPWVLEELTWLAECAEAPSRQESELAWFAKHFYRVLTQLPEWADALRTKR